MKNQEGNIIMSNILDFLLSEVMFYLETVILVLSEGVSSRYWLTFTNISIQIRGVLMLWE